MTQSLMSSAVHAQVFHGQSYETVVIRVTRLQFFKELYFSKKNKPLHF